MQAAFKEIKGKIAFVDVLVLLDFSKVFEVECDASSTRVGGVLSQEGRPICFYGENLLGSKLNYSTYDLEFYAMIGVLWQWRHYLVQREFILYPDHEALKYIS